MNSLIGCGVGYDSKFILPFIHLPISLFMRVFSERITQVRCNWFGNGYFSSEAEMKKNCERVNESAPDIVICGMGAPMQEKYLVNLKNTGWKGAGFTCGGYLDQIVERDGLAYYPDWANKYHLRALYRMFREPKRLIPRYTLHYMPFYIWCVKKLMTLKLKSGKKITLT